MLIIDRFEGNFAVCEDEGREMHCIPRGELPEDAREGDCLVREDGRWQLDRQEAQVRREMQARRLRALMRRK